MALEVPLPSMWVAADEVSSMVRGAVRLDDVAPYDRILDVGPKTAARLADIIAHAIPSFERPGSASSNSISSPAAPRCWPSAIAHSTGFSLAGGVAIMLAAIAKFHIAQDVDSISTGGRPSPSSLKAKVLPAIEVLGRVALPAEQGAHQGPSGGPVFWFRCRFQEKIKRSPGAPQHHQREDARFDASRFGNSPDKKHDRSYY